MSEHINLATYKKDGKTFQIDIDPDLAMDYKRQKNVDISDVLKVQNVFCDAKKGNLAKESDLYDVFKTDDVLEISKIIIEKGDVQISASYRKKEREKKKKEIIELIHRNAIDPSTKLPHPSTRIGNAIEEAKVQIDERKSANEQLDDIMKKIRVILPIKFEVKKLIITIPASYAAKSYGKVKNIGKMIKENWNNDGSLSITTEIPAGIELEVYDQINSLTHGQAEINEGETR